MLTTFSTMKWTVFVCMCMCLLRTAVAAREIEKAAWNFGSRFRMILECTFSTKTQPVPRKGIGGYRQQHSLYNSHIFAVFVITLCALWGTSLYWRKTWALARETVEIRALTFRHRASCILGQAFHCSPENAFYIFNQQIYFITWYLLDRASLI